MSALQQIKCLDDTMSQGWLVAGRVYMIDLRRDQEFSPDGSRYYFVNGRRYGAYRFERQ